MKEKIHAVPDKDVEKLLENLGLLNDIKDHLIFCGICGEPLSIENIGCIYPSEHEIKLCCDKLKCLQKTIDEITPMRRIPTKGGNKDEP